MHYTLLKFKRLLLGQKKVNSISNSCFYDNTKQFIGLNEECDRIRKTNSNNTSSVNMSSVRVYEKNNRRTCMKGVK